VIEPERLATLAGWSPYAGRVLHGRVRHVLARGEEVFADGEVLARPGRGAFVPAASAGAKVATHA
jgi:dihydroorotase-like cyclic amidohydrolase